ncbi:MAG: hypothetical protein HC820_01760 [Hydrococcus sp. RM1_1_31]|nr:hypothetical protein [Hydrococcus sp. RM1_1_31]
MLRNKTVEELLHFYDYYRALYPTANTEGRIVLLHFLRRLRKRIKRRIKKNQSPLVGG